MTGAEWRASASASFSPVRVLICPEGLEGDQPFKFASNWQGPQALGLPVL